MPDIGTYHVKVVLVDGRGFYMKWSTADRYIPNHIWRDGCSTLDASRNISPWTSEDDLVESVKFMFLEGNYSCDCNLGLFLARAEGQEDPEVECGDQIKLKSISLMRPDGSERPLWEVGGNQ